MAAGYARCLLFEDKKSEPTKSYDMEIYPEGAMLVSRCVGKLPVNEGVADEPNYHDFRKWALSTVAVRHNLTLPEVTDALRGEYRTPDIPAGLKKNIKMGGGIFRKIKKLFT